MPLTLAQARTYVDKGIDIATEMNLQLSFVVVAQFGQLIQIDRMDMASLMTPRIAEAKAITALNFKQSTQDLGERFQSRPDALRRLEQVVNCKLLTAGGGVPIFQDGRLVGAIGVSGGTAEEDHEVASKAVA